MSFMQRLLDTKNPNKKPKRYPPRDPENEMALFAQPSTQFLRAPSMLSRRRSQRSTRPRDDVDDFLSSDLELSFASTVSLNSPPRDSTLLTPDSEYAEPMDISPAPATVSNPLFPRAQPKENAISSKPWTRPRAFTSGARLFGRDVSNRAAPAPPVPAVIPAKPAQSNTKRTQRAALPLEWLATTRNDENQRKENAFVMPLQAPVSPESEDAMDVDSSFVLQPAAEVYSLSPAPASAAPTVTAFDTLFYDTMSPRRSLDSPARPVSKKRRSVSPESTRHSFGDDISSSPAPPSSPSQNKLDRITGGPLHSRFNKPTLEGLGAPSNTKRTRRPAFSAMVHPSDVMEAPLHALTSKALPPTRRAFSALLPPTAFGPEQSSDESSFDGPDMSSPAQAYAKRHHVKTIRRCDGTDDFRPLTGATAMVARDMQESPSSKFMSAGLPGFGDNEAHGKILPCHRVKEDGLMRINSRTLDDLLDGVYNSQIVDFHVIDCRFDYEYNGGHIPGAVNINTTTGVEDFLLASGLSKPRPCLSGDSNKKTILVFHCEFSCKRAPTFAKHLRAKDRAMNNHVYPKIHYPEVYILEGGYCQYFQNSAVRCQPSAYVTMDDPNHTASRREDMDQFRRAKFGRHKSYTYGDGPFKAPVAAQQSKRNTLPNGGGNPVFAAANAARTRRGGSNGLSTLAEDSNITAHSEDEDTDIGDSPCPPPTKTGLKAKMIGRAPLARAETYGPIRMPY